MAVLRDARLGTMRLNAARLDSYQPTLKITVNGVDRSATSTIRMAGLSIQDLLDGTPNTATLRVSGFTPVKGQEIQIALGQMDAAHFIFCGHILRAQQIYEAEQPANIAYDLSCISYEWLLNRRKVTVKYTNQSASDIVTAVIASSTAGFTVANVVPALTTIDEITFTNEDVTACLDRIAKRIGGYWYVDYAKDLHFFVTADSVQAGDITTASPRSARDIASTTDLSQVRTRVYGEGGGSVASVDVAVGDTTIPVDEDGWYSGAGGTVVSGPQRIAYTAKSSVADTGTTTAGSTSISAPGAPTAAVSSGVDGNMTGYPVISSGVRTHKVTFVTATGETTAGTASGSTTISAVNAPSGTPSASATTGGSIANGTYYYEVSYVTARGETASSASFQGTLSGGNNAFSISSIPTSGDGRTTARRVYRGKVGAPFPKFLVTTINDNSTTTYTDTTADGSLSATTNLSYDNGTAYGKVSLTSVPTSGDGRVTKRRIYRTTGGGSSYKLAGDIADNSTTTFTDNVADESLGAEAPSTSTIAATVGETTLRIADCAAVSASGGWARVASQLLRFTGRSTSSGEGNLTGIPASGTGSIVAAIAFGSSLVNAPHLTGVTGIVYAIQQGDELNVLATVNDTTAQTNMAGFVGGDGVHEEYVQDNRLSLTEITARATAQLTLVKDPLVTMTYETRDQTTRSGRNVTFILSAPTSITGTFKIQSVTMTDFDPLGRYFPRRQVEASSRRFTFESLLRLFKAA